MSELDPKGPITFRYQFLFPGGAEKRFEVQLDLETLQLIRPPRAEFPDWTALSFNQCPNCPLKESEHPRCPAATSLVDVVEFFGRSQSIERVEVRIATAERQYVKECSLQEGMSSLIGIYMVTSGCPVMAKLKPMVRYHLPFSTLDETRYRAISMYLLAQYFLARKGRAPDWALQRLVQFYEEVSTVNKHFFQRLTQIRVEDASLNALIRLDAFASTIAFTIDEHLLDELEQLFKAHFE